MQDLDTLAGGTDAMAGMINDRGQVVGRSYISSSPSVNCPNNNPWVLTTGSLIWDKGNGMRDLSGLGGTCTLASDLNNRGQVVGVSNLPGDMVNDAFVWGDVNGIAVRRG